MPVNLSTREAEVEGLQVWDQHGLRNKSLSQKKKGGEEKEKGKGEEEKKKEKEKIKKKPQNRFFPGFCI